MRPTASPIPGAVVLAASALAFVAALVPAGARADINVAVLGIQSTEGDDQAALQITQALRVGVGTIDGYDLLPTDASLVQMVLAHECEDPPSDRCLTDIATTLGAQRLVFGQLRRVSTAGSDYAFRLSLSVFNRDTGRLEQTFHEQIARTAVSSDALRDPARGYARRLLGISATGGGTIVIHSPVLAAVVQLDGETVGQTGDGPLVLRGVRPGPHELEISAPGRRAYTRPLTVGREPVEVTAELPALTGPTPYDRRGRIPREEGRRRGSDLRWLGWVGVGVGVVAGAVAVYSYLSWSDTGRGGNEATFDRYTTDVCPGADCQLDQAANVYRIEDVCAHADTHPSASGARSEVQDICSRGDTFIAITYVATGVALAAVTAGVVGIATLGPDDDGSDGEPGRDRATRRHRRARAHVPRLSPVVSPETVGISATVRF